MKEGRFSGQTLSKWSGASVENLLFDFPRAGRRPNAPELDTYFSDAFYDRGCRDGVPYTRG